MGRDLDHLVARILPQSGSEVIDLEEEAEGGKGVLAGGGGHPLRDERRQGGGGVAVKDMPRSVIAAGGARVGVRAASWTSRSETSAQREPHHRVPQTVRGDVLSQPARRASRATIRAASRRSSRPPVFDTSAAHASDTRNPFK